MEGVGFDTILYIIISIVVFIISVLGKNKKGKASRIRNSNWNPEANELNEKENLISSFEEIFNQPPDPVKHVKEDHATQARKKKESISTIEVVERSTKIPEIKVEKEPDGIEKNNMLDEFDLKKAIIYSEIINRKQF